MWSKMQKVNTKRTKWALSLIVILIAALFLLSLRGQQTGSPWLLIGATEYKLEVADTQEARVQGLSDRKSLAHDTALLFVFDESSVQCFWMKDMQFPIDMVWVDENWRVVHIERNVSPNTYPDEKCPEKPAKYVIETNANMTNQLRTGDHVRAQF